MAVDLEAIRKRLNDLIDNNTEFFEKEVGNKWKKKSRFVTDREYQIAAREILTCPHCGKSGRGKIMYRWHFLRCPKKDKNS